MNRDTEARQELRRAPRIRIWDALTDANPVLAKELLVTLRTPAYVRSMVGATLLLGTAVVWAGLGRGSLEYKGRELFGIYFTGLALVLGIVGGALGSTVIVQEREGGTLEALNFSSLSPRRIVFGKFAAIALAEGAIAVCTLPLLVLVLGVGVVSLGETYVAMSIALMCGALTASVGIAVSAHTANTRRSLLVSLLCSCVVGIGVTSWLAAGSELSWCSGPFGVARVYFEAPHNDAYFALLCIIPAYAVTTILWLGHASATTGLMDRSRDRGSPIKRWAVGTLGMGLVAFVICTRASAAHSREEVAVVAMIVTSSIAAALLFVFAGEPASPTRWMQAHPSSRLSGLLYPRCLAPSVLFTVLASGVALVSVSLLADSRRLEFYALWTVAGLSTLGGLIGSVAARKGVTRARALGAIALFLPPLIVGLLRDSLKPTWVDAFCPLWLSDGGGQSNEPLMLGSLLAWTVAAVASLGIMKRTIDAEARRTSGE